MSINTRICITITISKDYYQHIYLPWPALRWSLASKVIGIGAMIAGLFPRLPSPFSLLPSHGPQTSGSLEHRHGVLKRKTGPYRLIFFCQGKAVIKELEAPSLRLGVGPSQYALNYWCTVQYIPVSSPSKFPRSSGLGKSETKHFF